MKKFVLKLDLQDERDKRRAMKTVATLSGIDVITIDMKGQTLLVIGTVDPVTVVSKLRKKNWAAEIMLVGPAKDPPKKEEEPKKDEPKKEEEAKEEEPKKDEEKKEEPKKELVVGMAMPYRPYYPPMSTYYYANHSIEENPNACVIC